MIYVGNLMPNDLFSLNIQCCTHADWFKYVRLFDAQLNSKQRN